MDKRFEKYKKKVLKDFLDDSLTAKQIAEKYKLSFFTTRNDRTAYRKEVGLHKLAQGRKAVSIPEDEEVADGYTPFDQLSPEKQEELGRILSKKDIPWP